MQAFRCTKLLLKYMKGGWASGRTHRATKYFSGTMAHLKSSSLCNAVTQTPQKKRPGYNSDASIRVSTNLCLQYETHLLWLLAYMIVLLLLLRVEIKDNRSSCSDKALEGPRNSRPVVLSEFFRFPLSMSSSPVVTQFMRKSIMLLHAQHTLHNVILLCL